MAAIDTSKSYLVTGRLAYNVTDLGSAYPHGGTALGNVGSIFFLPPDGIIRLPACDSNETEAVLYTGGDSVLTASLEQWDNDALGIVFPSTTLQDSQAVIDFPEDEGETLASLTNLVFTPINQNHPSIILWNPVPHVQAQARMAFSARRWLSVPVAFIGLTNAAGVSATVGVLNALSIDPVTGLSATGGAEQIDLAWTNPTGIRAANSIVIRRAAGATAPTTVTGGTSVYDGALKTSHSDSVSAGQYSYSVFVGYDTTGDGNSDVYSSAVSDTATATLLPSSLSGVKVWLRASDSGTIDLIGGEVDKWGNQIAGEFDQYDAPTAGVRPVVTSGAINSKDAIRFASSNFLGDTTGSPPAPPVTQGPFHVFAIVKNLDDTAERPIFQLGTASTSRYMTLEMRGDVGGDPVRWTVNDSGAAGTASTSTGFTANTAHLIEAIEVSASSRKVKIDGGSEGTDTTTINYATLGADRTVLGANGRGEVANTDVAEIILCSQEITGSELTDLYSYFESEYGLTLP